MPGKLPGNTYAFKNCLFLNPADYQGYFEANGGRFPVYVKAKSMVLRLEKLEDIQAGSFGASALQKEAMRISKIDTLRVDPIRVTDENPLSTVECLVDVIFLDN